MYSASRHLSLLIDGTPWLSVSIAHHVKVEDLPTPVCHAEFLPKATLSFINVPSFEFAKKAHSLILKMLIPPNAALLSTSCVKDITTISF